MSVIIPLFLYLIAIAVAIFILSLLAQVFNFLFFKQKPYKVWRNKRKLLKDALQYFSMDLKMDTIIDVNVEMLETRYRHKKQIEALSGNGDIVEEQYQKILILIKEEREAFDNYDE